MFCDLAMLHSEEKPVPGINPGCPELQYYWVEINNLYLI